MYNDKLCVCSKKIIRSDKYKNSNLIRIRAVLDENKKWKGHYYQCVLCNKEINFEYWYKMDDDKKNPKKKKSQV